MPRWWNGRHACLRNKYRKVCEFESRLGHQKVLRVVSSVGTSVSFTPRMSAVRARHDPPSFIRSVAQPGSASGLGPEGPRFESLYSDHVFIPEYPSGSRGRTVNPLRNPPLVRIQPPEPFCWSIV